MTQTRRIMAAILNGARTSHEIARLLGASRSNISVALHRLADDGLVERAGVVNAKRIGRPYVRWRLRAPSITSSDSLLIRAQLAATATLTP